MSDIDTTRPPGSSSVSTRAAGHPPVPPYDPELEAVLAAMHPTISPITLADLPTVRAEDRRMAGEAVQRLAQRGFTLTEVTVDTADGAQLPMTLIQGPHTTPRSPLIYYIHGGGMMLGTRWSSYETFAEWIDRYGAVVATVEYRLAPEHPYPTPQEDCYSGLAWLREHGPEYGLAPDKVLVAGISAGGGLAASVTLMARSRGGPSLAGQLLLGPMLDDRAVTASSRQFTTGLWNSSENATGWRALLGRLAAGEHVPATAAPARNADFTDLPPTYIEVGSAEVFRDECAAYATRIWEAGGQAELHVWAGGFHGFDTHAHTSVAQAALEARYSWMNRTLGFTGVHPSA
ncbi:alpha/beta hydrolase [Streptomyces muensis]|uniref:Alpha/beta hydrolase n=1 Tax=Streptomyces muensis TaxID=1077944 RepID=A0A9X1THD1_STRM4|nr:alpha/beta hydrolase [Streptomyces muensis]MCF1592571.1 alpha/beta hydrolase [Streptomyces muensis]